MPNILILLYRNVCETCKQKKITTTTVKPQQIGKLYKSDVLNKLTSFKMNDMDASVPKPKKVGVWAEGTHIEAKEFVIPKKSPDSSDDIPTIPDLDDLQDILEKEISMPPVPDHKDTETVNALSEVGGGLSGSADSVEAVLDVLNSYIPQEEMDAADTVWTVDSLLQELAEESQE